MQAPVHRTEIVSLYLQRDCNLLKAAFGIGVDVYLVGLTLITDCCGSISQAELITVEGLQMNRDVGQTQSCKALNQSKSTFQVRATAAFDIETLQAPLPRLVLHDIDFHGIDNHICHH